MSYSHLKTLFRVSSCRTFNPADYTTDSGTSNSHADVWETGANDTTDGTGERRTSVAQNFSQSFGPLSSLFLSLTHSVAWQNTLDEWAAEDWSEDVSVSHAL